MAKYLFINLIIGITKRTSLRFREFGSMATSPLARLAAGLLFTVLIHRLITNTR